MKTVLLFILGLALPFMAFGKAAYYGKHEAIRSAEIIAIVDVQQVAPTNVTGKGWTYSEVASGTVEQVIKGDLPTSVQLYGGENFICAQVNYKPGRHLLFLRRDGDLLAGCNWHLGVLSIENDQVRWFADDKGISLGWAPLQTVLTEIKTTLENDRPVLVHLERGSRQP
ncbi:MAG: hypothetical protein ACK4UN_12935, partial [Limisphaerales bacterium]